MAKKMTSKSSLFGNRVSHSNRKIRHTQKPNLQKVKLNNGKTVILSTREIRTLNKKASDAKIQKL